MNLEEKAKIFQRCANAVQLPIDLVSAEVLLKLSAKIDEVGASITIQDIETVIEPYLLKQTEKEK
jgi:hypothetical protein